MNTAQNETATNTEAFALGPYAPTVFDHRDTKIEQINSAIGAAIATHTPLVALPDNFNLRNIETHLPTRTRACGTMGSPYIADFVSYAGTHREDGAAIFVDAENMHAVAVLNLGTPDEPGHADQKAELTPKRTAAYDALRNLVRAPQTQRDLAEWLEDWIAAWTAHDGETQILNHTALQAIRNLTIEAASRSEHKDESLSAARSTFESVTASSAHTLPSRFVFKCKPYPDLVEREFAVRLSVLTGESKPKFSLRITAIEDHIEQMASEFAVLIREATENTLPVLIGTYSKTN
ncbi:MAG: YfdQ family protein [Comamonas sp.]|uniref:DUF2303 family protein n=1 Tax=Comamonas sp. TaxID=34028 RepID=UPI002827FCBC|nr:DUF2303 family protein [Comamonas sp.]MDR0212528.1 YfdQ family protein [Comamonas sp.]